jgi:hypothetical protein
VHNAIRPVLWQTTEVLRKVGGMGPAEDKGSSATSMSAGMGPAEDKGSSATSMSAGMGPAEDKGS